MSVTKTDGPVRPETQGDKRVIALHKHHLSDLRKSGLSDEYIEFSGFKSHSMGMLSRIIWGGDSKNILAADSGYVIPYHDLNGRPTGAVRVRLFGTDKGKYRSPVGQPISIYIPVNLKTLLEAGNGVIFVTEGEKKAAKAVQEGIPCIAISGIDSWFDPMSRETEKDHDETLTHYTPVHPTLKNIIRDYDIGIVVIVGDSDTTSQSDNKKDKYRHSRLAIFADALRFQLPELRVALIACPAEKVKEEEGFALKKQGLDDWLITAGRHAVIGHLNYHAAKTAKVFSGVRPLDIEAFLRTDIKPPKLMLGEWLKHRNLVVVYAPRGLGKTQFSLELAIAVATGGECFGWRACDPQGVLYVDGEMSCSEMKQRLASIIISSETQADSRVVNFTVINPDTSPLTPDISTEKGRQEISNIARRNNAKLIVLDNISCLCRSGSYSENDAESWNAIQAWAVDMRSRGYTLIFVHHAGKSGQQRGTSKREDVMDVVVALKPIKDDDAGEEIGARFEIHFDKARGVFGEAVRPLRAELTTDDSGKRHWSVTDIIDQQADDVARLIAEGMTVRAIAEELGISKSKVSRLNRKNIEGNDRV